MPRPILARISLSALSHNLEVVTRQLKPAAAHRPRPLVWAVIKANAYGHGILNAVRGFSRADGLAMLDIDEAVRCRQAGWTKPILLLEGFFEPDDIAILEQYRISIAVHHQSQLDMLSQARPRQPIDALIKLNTGMNRLGFPAAQYANAYRQAIGLQEQRILGSLGKMTHFARADDDAAVTREQIDLFDNMTRDLPGKVSVCNSAGTLTAGLWSTLEPVEQWIRPGICLYGATPFDDKPASDFGLLPAMTLSAALISVRRIEAGAGVGYGHAFVAPEAMTIGVAACGYADGYPRHAPTGTPVCVDGVMTRTLGRLSMDMLIVDLSPAPQAHVGSQVVLWGEGGPSIDAVARAAGTLGYELMCAVAPRVPVVVV
ncbi:alanine racemase [Paralcaligenes ureilyticus]|uniref:Alanine racemase n=1 Tax=Paralcaligenes ureilyticus TaxID=627131 RepID=A0A4R3LWD4_9BURK|nr:alanine racemase [Paralcaligenes ureilyticus]TCT04884.1 alanine racemase [Paralcaligenes ureilyticus]